MSVIFTFQRKNNTKCFAALKQNNWLIVTSQPHDFAQQKWRVHMLLLLGLKRVLKANSLFKVKWHKLFKVFMYLCRL